MIKVRSRLPTCLMPTIGASVKIGGGPGPIRVVTPSETTSPAREDIIDFVMAVMAADGCAAVQDTDCETPCPVRRGASEMR